MKLNLEKDPKEKIEEDDIKGFLEENINLNISLSINSKEYDIKLSVPFIIYCMILFTIFSLLVAFLSQF